MQNLTRVWRGVTVLKLMYMLQVWKPFGTHGAMAFSKWPQRSILASGMDSVTSNTNEASKCIPEMIERTRIIIHQLVVRTTCLQKFMILGWYLSRYVVRHYAACRSWSWALWIWIDFVDFVPSVVSRFISGISGTLITFARKGEQISILHGHDATSCPSLTTSIWELCQFLFLKKKKWN